MEARERSISTGSQEYHDDLLDPRIQTELEKLNKASEDINRLELELDEARANFRQVLSESSQRLNALAKKLGNCIEKARPYYEARMQAKEAQLDSQNVALRFERACGQLAAAKEMVFLAEQGFFKKGQPFDPAWQEMLNHATMKVNDAERERLESEVEHRGSTRIFNEAEQMVKHLQKELKRSISKSRPYFEMKAGVNHIMEEQKKRVGELESDVTFAKKAYKEALGSLEAISDEIHQQRREANLREEMGTRGSGVGAEAPSPPPHSETSSGSTSTPSEGTVPDLDTGPATDLRDIDSQMYQIKIHSAIQRQESGEGQEDTTSLSRNSGRSHSYASSQKARDTNAQQHLPFRSEEDTTQRWDKRPHKLEMDKPLKGKQVVGIATVEPKSGTHHETNVKDTSWEDTAPTNKGERNVLGGEVSVVLPKVPVVELTSPGESEAPMSPGRLISPDSEADLEQTKTNAAIMESLQRQKGIVRPFLRANRRSQDDLLSEASDSESMTGSIASASMLDDEQIESLMLETSDYSRFISKMDDSDAAKWKRMSLPTKLSYLENHIDFKPVWIDMDMSPEADSKIQESSMKDIIRANKAPTSPKTAATDDLKTPVVENVLLPVLHHPLEQI